MLCHIEQQHDPFEWTVAGTVYIDARLRVLSSPSLVQALQADSTTVAVLAPVALGNRTAQDRLSAPSLHVFQPQQNTLPIVAGPGQVEVVPAWLLSAWAPALDVALPRPPVAEEDCYSHYRARPFAAAVSFADHESAADHKAPESPGDS